MSVHLLKPALRAQDVYELMARQAEWLQDYQGGKIYPVWTSRRPARLEELLDGGSVYWIVRKAIQCRQKIVGFQEIQEEDEKPSYLILCDAELIRTEPFEHKPFQGWRYLEGAKVPPDIGQIEAHETPPPEELEKELRQAGLL